MPTCGGIPPAVRKRARAVMVRSRSVSSPRPSAVTLNESMIVWRCGLGRMPAWYRPWNGTAGSRPASISASRIWPGAAARDEP